MIENELSALRRANPVAVDAVTDLVAAHRSALGEAIRDAREDAPGGAAAVEDATRSGSVEREAVAGRGTRRRLVATAAATIAVVALPALLLARGALDNRDLVDDDLPVLDELPPPSDVSQPEDPRGTDDEDDLLVPVTPPTPTTPPSSPPPATSAMVVPPTTVAPGNDATAPPLVPASTPPLPGPTTVAPSGDAAPAPATSPSGTAPPPATSPTPSSAPPAVQDPTDTDVGPPTRNDTSQPFDPDLDLLVVTLDFANRDDGHAAVATRELATTFDLAPLVVAGTPAPDSSWFVPEYPAMMDAAWGPGWLDATSDRPGAVIVAADRWLDTIDSGGVVRVAEGGVSDFTADVLREVRNRQPALDTAEVVQVVHHSGRNEDETRSGDLDFVRATTTYARIDDGNSENDTADLKRASSVFESAALSGRHAAAWTAAFEFLPAASLDFSDTVTALHILGIDTDEVADPDDFADVAMR